MKKCKKCGAEFADEFDVCPRCGEAVPVKSKHEKPKIAVFDKLKAFIGGLSKKQKIIIGAVAAVVLLIIIIIVAVSSGNSGGNSVYKPVTPAPTQSAEDTVTEEISTTKEDPSVKLIAEGDTYIKTVEDYIAAGNTSKFDENMYSNLDAAKEKYSQAKAANAEAAVDEKLAKVESLRGQLDKLKKDAALSAFIGKWSCYKFEVAVGDSDKDPAQGYGYSGEGYTLQLNKNGTFEHQAWKYSTDAGYTMDGTYEIVNLEGNSYKIIFSGKAHYVSYEGEDVYPFSETWLFKLSSDKSSMSITKVIKNGSINSAVSSGQTFKKGQTEKAAYNAAKAAAKAQLNNPASFLPGNYNCGLNSMTITGISGNKFKGYVTLTNGSTYSDFTFTGTWDANSQTLKYNDLSGVSGICGMNNEEPLTGIATSGTIKLVSGNTLLWGAYDLTFVKKG